ncbi:hypothetical protein KY285_019535 [Solanum tuberosum]|nr:hypothetical protein KY285_019535 [Solanum tuberosum]
MPSNSDSDLELKRRAHLLESPSLPQLEIRRLESDGRRQKENREEGTHLLGILVETTLESLYRKRQIWREEERFQRAEEKQRRMNTLKKKEEEIEEYQKGNTTI